MSRSESIIRRFPDFFDAGETHSVFYRLIAVFGDTLDQVESDLLRVMRAHWVDTADNEGSRGFNTPRKGDLDKIFTLYLENLGGTSRLKQTDRRDGAEGKDDDDLYRQRIRALIEVLMRGASTREGILAVVAANLGIVGDSAEARAARERIRIVEFLPEPTSVATFVLRLFEGFTVHNPNVIDAMPEIRLQVRADLPVPLLDPRLVNLTTGGHVGYPGTLAPGDALAFFADGSALLNGVAITPEGTVPALPPGASAWRFEASLGRDEGSFDQTLFDFASFEQQRLDPVGVFDLPSSVFDQAIYAYSDAAVDLEMTISKLTPASFMVRIPWDIPGYTDSFDELGDHPRNQLKYIVDKVKAAGVFAVVAYDKTFSEDHRMADALTARLPLVEEHLLEEAEFDLGGAQTPYPDGVEHAMEDRLVTSGAFDLTAFDTLNTFA